jgi:hypothetical protein
MLSLTIVACIVLSALGGMDTVPVDEFKVHPTLVIKPSKASPDKQLEFQRENPGK